jgi:hypothetical protein
MTGREKPKRRALQRGLDDIVNRDASLTSKLLGRMKPPTREPLEVSEEAAEPRSADASSGDSVAAQTSQETTPPPVMLRPRAQDQPSSVPRLDEARAESRAPVAAGEATTAAPVKSVTTAPSAPMTFNEFVERWGFILRSGGRAGKLRICQTLYENTYGAGQETFFTSYEQLATLTPSTSSSSKVWALSSGSTSTTPPPGRERSSNYTWSNCRRARAAPHDITIMTSICRDKPQLIPLWDKIILQGCKVRGLSRKVMPRHRDQARHSSCLRPRVYVAPACGVPRGGGRSRLRS